MQFNCAFAPLRLSLARGRTSYKLHEEWGTYGLPQHFYTDGGKDFRSNHLNQIGVQLGFVCHLRDRPSVGLNGSLSLQIDAICIS